MCILKRISWISLFAFVTILESNLPLKAFSHNCDNLPKQHALIMYGQPKYGLNFSHFDYVNPNAPKGGTLVIGTVGTFDTLNPYDIKGIPPISISMTVDSLMVRSRDEAFTMYGLVAKNVCVTPDFSSMTFYLDERAKFSDGSPITTKDVEFSFNILKQKGTMAQRHHYSKIKSVRVINGHTITFIFAKKPDGSYDKELPLIISKLNILSKDFFDKHDFQNLGMQPFLASGPYKIKTANPGRSIVFERNKNYWAQDLPVNKGMYNFDYIHIHYYKNKQSLIQAFLAGEIDFYAESNPQDWKNNIKGPMIASGKIEKLNVTHQLPVTVSVFLMNLRRPIFQNEEVRKALKLAFDFETLNKMAYDGQLQQANSLFANTILQPPQLPMAAEKRVLQKFIPPLPEKILHESIDPQFSSYREKLIVADTLLKTQGWIIVDGKRVHQQTGAPLTFEFLIKDQALEKIALWYKKNLEKLGIFISVRLVDTVQYEKRTSGRDFDMIVHYVSNSLSPGIEQTYYYTAKLADVKGSSNYMGIKDKVIESLANELATVNNYEELIANVHALDRVMQFKNYFIPFSYNNTYYWAYWADRIDFKLDPKVGGNIIEWGWSKK